MEDRVAMARRAPLRAVPGVAGTVRGRSIPCFIYGSVVRAHPAVEGAMVTVAAVVGLVGATLILLLLLPGGVVVEEGAAGGGGGGGARFSGGGRGEGGEGGGGGGRGAGGGGGGGGFLAGYAKPK